MTGSLATQDPFFLRENFNIPTMTRGFHDTYFKTLYNPRSLDGDNVAVLIALGQSNICNYGNFSYSTVSSEVYNLNLYDGGLYNGANSLLGCDGISENFLVRLADKLIAANTYDAVVLVPAGIGGTPISDWAAGGICNERIGVAIKRTLAAGLTPTHVLWMQGETDTVLGTSQANYTTGLTSVIATIRADLPTTPILVSKTSAAGGTPSANVVAAQAAAVNEASNIYAGPDTDSLDGTYRHDGTHWNATGSAACADLWQTAIGAV